MITFIVVLHVFVCVALILIVLLQTGKGADMGAAFGGGSSQTLFGSTGASTFLGKATTVVAVIFMITSLALAYVTSGPRTDGSIMTEEKAPLQQSAPGTSAPAAPEKAKASPEASPQGGRSNDTQQK